MRIEWQSKPKWQPIRVRENMSPNVESVTGKVSAAEIAKIMRKKNIGCVPVVEDGNVVGMITDRDIVCRVAATNLDLERMKADEIMSKPISVCYEDDLLVDAAHIMERDQVRRLPVLNQDKQLVGILTADDLSWHTDHQLLGDVIESVSEHHG